MRKFMFLVLTLVVAVSFSFGVTITMMTPLTGADGAYMDEIVAKFNAEHPDIEVVHVVVESSLDMKNKLSMGIASKTAPEIMFIRKFDMPLYLEHFKGFTTEEWLNESGIDTDDIFPGVLDGLVVDGKVVGIPMDILLFYMAYNRGNFAEVGLDPDNPPKTRDEFISAMEALIPITPPGLTPYYENPAWTWIWFHLLWQHGGEVLTDDFKEPAFEKAGIEVCKLMLEMQDKGILPMQVADPGVSFQSGESTVLITGIWTIKPWMEQLGEDFGYAVAPQLGNTKAVFGGSHVLAMPTVMVEDPKVLGAATTFIKYLWDHAIDWYEAGQTPARKSVAESQELKERLPHIYAVSQDSEYVRQFQMFPLISEIEAEIAVYLEEVLVLHSISPEAGMKEAAFAVQEILDDYWSRN